MQASPVEIATSWLTSFFSALERGDVDAALECVDDEGFWRDFLAFTWNLETLEGREQITDMLRATLAQIAPSHWRLTEATPGDVGTTEAWFEFETAQGTGYGQARIRDGRCLTVLTTLTDLRGYEERAGRHRPRGGDQGARSRRPTSQQQRPEGDQPYCLIVGGGQGGIALAARLKALDVPTVVVDQNDRAGDAWRNRYESLYLHDPVWNCHLPYLDFPSTWPIFMSKDQMGDWLEHYVDLLGLPYWAGTECVQATFDAEEERWSVELDRRGERVHLRPAHVVFATGVSGYPNVPAFAGAERFEGTQYHSSLHPGGLDWTGKKAVVVGSSNSAHDICVDLLTHGADVTMIQRSSTLVVKVDTVMDVVSNALYSEDALDAGITVEQADHLSNSVPLRVLPLLEKPVYQEIARRDADFYAKLSAAGFALDFGTDDSGMVVKYLRRGSGYYIDVGASQLIIDGEIAIKTGEVSEITSTGILMEDGSTLDADLIVYATGYGSMSQRLAPIISSQEADLLGRCWGYGSATPRDPGPWVGELRNMWKPTNVPNLWIHGGNLEQSRYFSKYLALQIKARMEEFDTPVYAVGRLVGSEA